MPTRPPKPCAHAGCRALNVAGTAYCAGHQADATEWKRAHEAKRPNARQRGYTTKWEKARADYLRRHPMCCQCTTPTKATRVDHITPHRGDQKLFWDRKNWQPLCETHHNRKTATEDSGFARRAR